MRIVKKIFLWIGGIIAMLYLGVVVFFYFMQENILFFPERLSEDYVFDYTGNFEEVYFTTDDNIKLHGLYFKADSSRGLVFYLHGNAGSLRTWGRVARPFLANNYDCFVLDYRGFGKSEGDISSEEQLLNDVAFAYNQITSEYKEENVIIVGYSLGTGPAAYLASINQPQMLILKAPYYSMNYMRQKYYSWLPEFGMRYKLATNEYLEKTKAPIVIFHGDQDNLIPYESSLKLVELLDEDDQFIPLLGQGHHRLSDNEDYLEGINNILRE